MESAANSVDYNKTNVKDHIKSDSINVNHSLPMPLMFIFNPKPYGVKIRNNILKIRYFLYKVL